MLQWLDRRSAEKAAVGDQLKLVGESSVDMTARHSIADIKSCEHGVAGRDRMQVLEPRKRGGPKLGLGNRQDTAAASSFVRRAVATAIAKPIKISIVSLHGLEQLLEYGCSKPVGSSREVSLLRGFGGKVLDQSHTTEF